MGAFWKQLRAVVWLRFRLGGNKLERSGQLNFIIARIVLAIAIAASAVSLPVGIAVGYSALGTAPPPVVFNVWGGVAVAFLFFWVIGLMSELEQVELLALDKFLHLPVSPASAFLVNYAGSSFGLALLLFVPGTIGMSAGMLLARGASMLVLFVLVPAFFLMVTAVTYQFQGWLALLMANPRRRQTVLAVVTVGFMLIFFLPQLANWDDDGPDEASGTVTRERVAFWSAIFPPGWLPVGARYAAEGRPWPSFAGALGMALVGAFSLSRSYRTAIRRYTGAFDSGGRPRRKTLPARPRAGSIVEARLAGLSEQVSAVAVVTFRSFARAPELKLMLLSPVLVLILFGQMLRGMAANEAGFMAPLTAFSAAALMLSMSMIGFIGNLFAFDRAGLRVFILGPIARHDVLLGKNLGLAPFAFALMALAIVVSEWFRPMRVDHLVAVAVSTIPMYLAFCVAGNALSILAPMAVKRGSGWPVRNQGIKPLIQALVMFALPGVFGLTLWPLGVEFLASVFLDWNGVPLFAVLAIVQAGVFWILFRRILVFEGEWLYRRECRILDAVARQSE